MFNFKPKAYKTGNIVTPSNIKYSDFAPMTSSKKKKSSSKSSSASTGTTSKQTSKKENRSATDIIANATERLVKKNMYINWEAEHKGDTENTGKNNPYYMQGFDVDPKVQARIEKKLAKMNEDNPNEETVTTETVSELEKVPSDDAELAKQEVESELQKADAERDSVIGQKEEAEQEKTQIETESSQSESEVEKARQELEQLQQEIQSLQQQKSALEAEIAQLQNEKATISSQENTQTANTYSTSGTDNTGTEQSTE